MKEWPGPAGQGTASDLLPLTLWGIPLYEHAQAQDFQDPTSVPDVPLAYKKIVDE